MGKGSLALYLSSLRSDHEPAGSGEFTIDLETALAKLSSFSLGAPADIFLKAVQAGVAGAAEKIELIFGIEDIEVIFDGLAHKSTEAVAEAFLPGKRPVDAFVAELVIACRALLEESEFCLYGDGSIRFLPGLELESDPEHQEQSAFKLVIKRPAKGALAKLFVESRHPDFKNFSRRLEHCPFPLFVNGFRLQARLGSRAQIFYGAVCHIACYGAVVTEERRAQWASELITERSQDNTYVPVHAPVERGRDWAEFWCVARHAPGNQASLLEQPSLAQFLRYGVVCAETSLAPGLPGSRLVIHANDAETDLSGLSMEAPWSEDELRAALNTLWTDSQNSIRRSLSLFPEPPAFLNDTVEVPRKKGLALAAFKMVGACLALLFPIAMVLTVAAATSFLLLLLVLCILAVPLIWLGSKAVGKEEREHNQNVDELREKREQLEKAKAAYWRSTRPKFALQKLLS